MSKILIGWAEETLVPDKKIALAGGVASNSRLRLELENRKGSKSVYYPSPILCTDNGAMVACCAYHEWLSSNIADISLNAIPFLSVELI